MKSALTDLSVKRFPVPDKGNAYHWDKTQPGLGLRVGAGGARTFLVLLGSGQRQTIGRYPTISLADARSQAKRLLAEKTLGKLRPRRIAFEDAKDEFLADAAKRNRPRTVKDYTRLLHRLSFKRAALADISKQEVAKKLTMPPSEARHALVAAKVFFSWCVRQGHIEQSPCDGLRGPGKGEARERVLADKELAEVMSKASAVPYPFGPIVLLLVLTGQRRGEIAALKWTHIDQQERTITFPASLTKNRRQHFFPYGQRAAEVLAQVPVQGDYLFPAARSHVRGEPTTVFNGWPNAKVALDARLVDVAPWTLHDLRRTFSSNLAALGVAPHVTEKLLNHISGIISGVAAIYNRHSYLAEMRAGVTAWELKLQTLLDSSVGS